jgi:CBS domain-containing protein
MKIHPLNSISICNSDESIRTALTRLNSNQRGFLIVTNIRNEPLGIFTDGDAIRLFLSNNRLLADLFTDNISQIMNTKFISVLEATERKDIIKIFITKKINFLPVLDNEKKLLGVYLIYDFLDNE